MRPIPHRPETETREGNRGARGGARRQPAEEEEDDEAWLAAQEF